MRQDSYILFSIWKVSQEIQSNEQKLTTCSSNFIAFIQRLVKIGTNNIVEILLKMLT